MIDVLDNMMKETAAGPTDQCDSDMWNKNIQTQTSVKFAGDDETADAFGFEEVD